MARKVFLRREVALFPEYIQYQPPLKWAGGKRWLVPVLANIYKHFSDLRLVEPFVGGMAITLGLLPNKAVLNDINTHLINFYRHLQKGLIINIPMLNDKQYYYKARARFNDLIRAGKSNTREAAELFYFLNRTGYNGLCRFNKRGEFNVPYGKYKKITYKRDFLEYVPILKNYIFISNDFRLIKFKSSDFIYADPPYDVEFTEYSAGGFSFNDQIELAKVLSRHSGPVIISNQATKRIIQLYQDFGFTILFLSGPRRISSNGDRTPAVEVLATKAIDSALLENLPLLQRSPAY